MKMRHHAPEENVLVGLVLEDPRYLSPDSRLHRALLEELRDGGFPEEFIWERFPTLRPYLRIAKKPQRLASAKRSV